MQEEVEQRIVSLMISCGKLGEQEFRKAVAKLLEQLKNDYQKYQHGKANPHGKMTVKQLAAKDKGLQSIEVTDQNTVDDLKAVSKAVNYLKEQGLFTLEDLDTALQGVNEKSKSINAAMKKASARMKVITGIQNAVADCQTHKAVHDKYLKIGWKARQAAFAESHKDELDRYNKAFRYLKKQGVDLNVNLQALQVEYDQLQATYTELAGQLAAAKEELQPMKDIRYWVSKVLTPEQSEVEKKPEPKHSITEKMKFLQEQSSNQQEQKTPQQKKQNILWLQRGHFCVVLASIHSRSLSFGTNRYRRRAELRESYQFVFGLLFDYSVVIFEPCWRRSTPAACPSAPRCGCRSSVQGNPRCEPIHNAGMRIFPFREGTQGTRSPRPLHIHRTGTMFLERRSGHGRGCRGKRGGGQCLK